MKFIKSNVIFFIWLAVYIALFTSLAMSDPEVFFAMLVLELISIAIAFSPLGEKILRVMSGARKIRTERDREYLAPIFEAVYSDVQAQNKRISQKIALYIEESKDINAYAFGSNSISVTRGAMEALSENQLKGVIAHELGHMNNGDTKVALVMTIGNGAFTVLWLILKSAMRFKNEDLKLVFLFNALIGFIVRVFTSIGDRHSEYMADEFAYQNGYGDVLIDALYFLQELSTGQRLRLRDRLRASHPHLDKRIARLESLQKKLEKESVTES